MLIFLIYLISTLGNLKIVLSLYLTGLLLITAIIIIFTLFSVSYGNELNLPEFNSRIKSYLTTFKYWIIIPIFLFAIAPSQKTQYLMLGTYVAQASVEKMENSKIMDKVSEFIQFKIDEIISEENKDSNKSDKDSK